MTQIGYFIDYKICEEEYSKYMNNHMKKISLWIILMLVIVVSSFMIYKDNNNFGYLIITFISLFFFFLIGAYLLLVFIITKKNINIFRKAQSKKMIFSKTDDMYIISFEDGKEFTKFKSKEIKKILKFNKYIGIYINKRLLFIEDKDEIHEFFFTKNNLYKNTNQLVDSETNDNIKINNETNYIKVAKGLIILSIISIIVVNVIRLIHSEWYYFSYMGFIRKGWYSLFSLPFTIVPVLYIYKNFIDKKNKCKIISILILVFNVIFCIESIVGFSNVSFETEDVIKTEQIVNFEFPNKFTSATETQEHYTCSYVKIKDNQERIDFENSVKSSELWDSELESGFVKKCTYIRKQFYSDANYFLVYDKIHDTYHTVSKDEKSTISKYAFVLVAYNSNTHKITLVNVIYNY